MESDQRSCRPYHGHGLYDPRDERDACGFGLIAHLDDKPGAGLVKQALDALSRMAHRGGVAADGRSGDGCGLLMKTPDAFLRALAAESGIALGQRYASGIVFMPHGDDTSARVHGAFSQALREGFKIIFADLENFAVGFKRDGRTAAIGGADGFKRRLGRTFAVGLGINFSPTVNFDVEFNREGVHD